MALIGHMGNHGSSARADVAEKQILSQRIPFDGIPVRAGIMSLSQRELSRPADVREAGYTLRGDAAYGQRQAWKRCGLLTSWAAVGNRRESEERCSGLRP